MLSNFEEALDILLADTCGTLGCGKIPATPDCLGFFWCEECSHRRYLLQWGKVHNWPALAYGEYALAQGLDYWGTTALLGDDERVCALLAGTEEWDENEVEVSA